MPTKAASFNHTKIAVAALRLASTKSWAHVTLDDIAKAAKVPAAAFKNRFTMTAHLIPIIAAEIDREAFAGQKFSGAPHDILFDIFMARFDVMQKHRNAIEGIADAARQDRALSWALASATMDGAYLIIDRAKFKKPARPMLALGLFCVYSWAFFAWRRDTSRDMAKTMAALDRALRLAGKAEELITSRS